MQQPPFYFPLVELLVEMAMSGMGSIHPHNPSMYLPVRLPRTLRRTERFKVGCTSPVGPPSRWAPPPTEMKSAEPPFFFFFF